MVSDNFPVGLRILLVDGDPTCLQILSMMLRTCWYEVTTCDRAEVALSILRSNRNGFDIVLSEVHLPGMDGIELLERIDLEMDLPVIVMSVDGDDRVIMKGVTHGACDYLVKPIRIELLSNIWQQVVRKRRRMDDLDKENDDYMLMPKKPGMVWLVGTHQKFVAALNHLGIDKAVPTEIMELMNVPGLTREDIAWHLQKYRLHLTRLSSMPQGRGGPSVSTHGTAFVINSSLSRLDPQSPVANNQQPTHTLAKPKPAPKSSICPPVQGHKELVNRDNAQISLGEARRPLLNCVGPEEVKLLHGIGLPAEMLERIMLLNCVVGYSLCVCVMCFCVSCEFMPNVTGPILLHI